MDVLAGAATGAHDPSAKGALLKEELALLLEERVATARQVVGGEADDTAKMAFVVKRQDARVEEVLHEAQFAAV